jgi:hypothetical protein
MHVTSYVTNNFHPCLSHSTPFDLLLGQSSSCTWFEFWAHPEKAYQRFACFFSIAIGLLIFNHLMLRTLYGHIFAFSLPFRVLHFTLLFVRIFLRFPAVFLPFLISQRLFRFDIVLCTVMCDIMDVRFSSVSFTWRAKLEMTFFGRASASLPRILSQRNHGKFPSSRSRLRIRRSFPLFCSVRV